MEQIFKKFLQEQGVYEMFTKFVLKHYKCSLQHYCKEHRISEYCLELNRSPLFTRSKAIALNVLWKQCWSKAKQKVLYDFIVQEGCLFQFLEAIPKGVTIEILCSDPNNIKYAFLGVTRTQETHPFWNKIGKHWRKHLKEKVFTFN